MKTSPETVETIADVYEHLMLEMYNDADKNATIGYGHLIHYGPINGSESAEFKAGITKARALELLTTDLAWAEHCVNHFVPATLDQNQFDALVSFTFNCGVKNLCQLVKVLKTGSLTDLPAHIVLYDKSGGIRLGGLIKRRKWEAELFQKAVV